MQGFEFVEPDTVAEAVATLVRHGPGATLLGGGQSLLILLRQRLATPDVLVGLRRIDRLDHVTAGEDGLLVGAMATYASLAGKPVAARWRLLALAAGAVGSRHIRARGTIGGSLAHADPAGDVPVALAALEATVTVAGATGPRVVPADGFATGLFRTRLAAGELIESIAIPNQPAGATVGYERFSLREGELPLAQVAVRLEWAGDDVRAARVVVGGGGDHPMRLSGVEHWLVGTSRGDREGIARATAAQARPGLRPFGDVRGSAEWKRDVVSAVTGRAVARAFASVGDRADG